jgi:hypothetical protein
MNSGTRNLKKALSRAQKLADEAQLPYAVFIPYMPSVYAIRKAPYVIERVPDWRTENLDGWAREKELQGAHVVWPKKK